MPYKPLFKNADEYIGLDVDTAKEYGFQANGVTYYDGRDIPFSDCSVYYILSVSAFEHIDDLPHTLEELFRVLKHGGTLCATVPMIFGLHYEPYDFRRFTYYGLIRMMEQAGFHHIECSGSNRPVDTMRFLGIYGHLRILRPLRVLYANLSFLIGRSKAFLAVENMARRVLGRGKSELYMEYLPLDLLLVCSKD